MSHEARFAPEPESEPAFNALVDTDPDQQFNVRQADQITGYLDDDADDYSHTPLDFSDERMTQLGLTLDFGPRDLAANREGWLTEAQTERLAGDLRWVYWPIIIALVVIALVIGAGSISAGTLTAMPFALLGLAAIPALLLKNERERLPEREVRATTLRLGRVSMAVRRWGLADDEGPGGRVKLPVDGGKRIFGHKNVYKSLQPNQTYIAYYVPVWTWWGYRLLSVEPRDAEKAKGIEKRKLKSKRNQRL